MVDDFKSDVLNLPAVSEFTEPMLQNITGALNVDRDFLATESQIQSVWNDFPKLLSKIPHEKRNEAIMSMCIAVAAGLFDSAINYAWNATITELRNKVIQFDIHFIPRISGKSFDNNKMMNMRDNELLTLCLELNLISEDGHFMLNQCRELRNNFSAAHPAIGKIDDYELKNFLNRCIRHALNDEKNKVAVDIKEFVKVIDTTDITQDQLQFWAEKIEQTYDAQYETIVKMLHSTYCNPDKEQHVRSAAITICNYLSPKFTPSVASELINQHQEYIQKDKQERLSASQLFFGYIGQIKLLSDSEKHNMISSACKSLIKAHDAMNNFYNERPYAERLATLTLGHQIPETVKNEFVKTVVICYVGNPYGTAHSAEIYYKKMIMGFSPKEIEIMFSLPSKNPTIKSRVMLHGRCKEKFAQIVGLIHKDSITTKMEVEYKKWIDS